MVYSMHRKNLWRLHVQHIAAKYLWLIHVQDEPVHSPTGRAIMGASAVDIREVLTDAARAVDERDGPTAGPVPKPSLISK